MRAREIIQGRVDIPLIEEKFIRSAGETIQVEVVTLSFVFQEKPAVQLVFRDITKRKGREHEREAILELASALRSTSIPTEMYPVILEHTADLLKSDCALLAVREGASNKIVIQAGKGLSCENAVGRQLALGDGVIGSVIASGKDYLNNHALQETLSNTPVALDGLQAVACIPLIALELSIGALWIGRAAEISADELRTLKALGDMAANAIRRASLHEQTEHRLQRLSALRAIDLTITASQDLYVTLNVLVDQVTSKLHIDAADILLVNPFSFTLEYAAGSGFITNSITRSDLHLGEGFAGAAALERRMIAVENLAAAGSEFLRDSLLAGEGFVTYYCVPLIAKGQVKGALEVLHRSFWEPDPEWVEFLEALASQAAIAIDNSELFNDLQRSNIELRLAYDATLEGWVKALDLRDKETEGHTQRVTKTTLHLASVMGMGAAEQVNIRRGALLHDIGKMAIPDGILHKPGPLSAEERQLINKHPGYAYNLLSGIPFLRPAQEIPYCHHEKWDGSGYPRGLEGEQIPLAARIFTVVDVWDALSYDRPYRKAWPEQKVLNYLKKRSGKDFDPRVVQIFLSMLAEEKMYGP